MRTRRSSVLAIGTGWQQRRRRRRCPVELCSGLELRGAESFVATDASRDHHGGSGDVVVDAIFDISDGSVDVVAWGACEGCEGAVEAITGRVQSPSGYDSVLLGGVDAER